MSRGARAILAAVLAVGPWGCRAERKEPPPGVLTLTAVEQNATWIRNFNPLLPGTRWPAACGIHEPLAIHNSVTGEWVPWLATAWDWSEDATVLTFTVREGVEWSDGAPFTADDVVFTFELMRRFPALDQKAVWRTLSEVTAEGSTVRFRFSRPSVPTLATVAHQPIVPRHVWEGVADPVTFTNAEPVATGPFTVVRLFQNQVYELGKNPRYWQPGKPAIEAIRLPAFPANDQANLALIDGELDWAANYVPAVDRVFTRRDPRHHHHWFPPTGTTVFLYANTTRPPLDDVRVRKALSMAIDRGLVVDVAMSRYTRPADATALSGTFDRWRDPSAVAAGTWTTFDAAAARRALEEAGLRPGPSGARTRPDGTELELTITVVNGWSDWVRAAQVISRNLRDVGITAQVRLLDQGTWFQTLQLGDFDLSVGWSIEGATPYEFYWWLMSADAVAPVGTMTTGNWHRYGSEKARPVFTELERTVDPARQRELVAALQHLFVEEAPAVPLFPNPAWGEYNDRRFVGFPDATNPWAALSPNKSPDALLVLTHLKPRHQEVSR